MDRTGNHVLSMARLAKDVLAEIPDQFISYMKSRGIKPNPAPPPYTPPGHTHHHTQIWSPPPPPPLPLSTEDWQHAAAAQSPVGTLYLLFFGCKQEMTHQEMSVERKWILVTYWRSILFYFCGRVGRGFCDIFIWFLLKRGCKLLFPGLRQWLFHLIWQQVGSKIGHVVVKTCACLWLFL